MENNNILVTVFNGSFDDSNKPRRVNIAIPVNAVDQQAAADAIKTAIHGAVIAVLIDRHARTAAAVERAYDRYNETVNRYGRDANVSLDMRIKYIDASERMDNAYTRLTNYVSAIDADTDFMTVCDNAMTAAAKVFETDNIAALIAWLYAPSNAALAWSANDRRLFMNVAAAFRAENTKERRDTLATIFNRRTCSKTSNLFKNWKFRMTAEFFDDMSKFATVTMSNMNQYGFSSKGFADRRIMREFVLRALSEKFQYAERETKAPAVKAPTTTAAHKLTRAADRAAADAERLANSITN